MLTPADALVDAAAVDKLFCRLVVDVECFETTDKGAFSAAGVNDFLRFNDPTAAAVECDSEFAETD